MNVKSALAKAKSILKKAGIESYFLDAELIMTYVIGFTKVQLFTKDNYELSKKEEKTYFILIEQRKNYKPVQYITGNCEFMGINFKVNESTLIPRQDTEILAETVIQYINKHSFKAVLDLCTGSGAIAVSIAKFCKHANVTATDISEKAINTAIKNSILSKTNDCINFIVSDIFENIPEYKYDIIVSNPPYIKTEDINDLSYSVKGYEPRSALDGGKDGLDFYKKITMESINYIKKDGMLFYEIGYEQSENVSNILKEYGYYGITTIKDLAGLNRVVYGYKS